MGASDHLTVAAAKPRPRRPCAATVLGEPLVASDDYGLVHPSADFAAQALVSSPQQYQEMYQRSIDDPAGFWSEIAETFYWKQKWSPDEVCTENLDVTKGPIKIEWFKGGKTNICYNAVDRNVEAGDGEKIAVYWEGNEPDQDGKLTYSELLDKVCQLANYLKSVGVGKGDAVVIYLPMLMELPIAMLACARIGAVHSVVFAGFSSDALAQRIIDCKPKVVITCNAVKRGLKLIPLKDIVDPSLVESAKNGVTVGICLTYENQSAMKKEDTRWKTGRDVWWQDVVPNFPTKCDVEWVDAEDPLFLLYTSGSTGKPKGVLHTTGGYMVYTATTFKHAFDYKPTDIYWCTADCGWITGHSYVTYGPLLNGATVLVYEGAPNYPDPGRCWDIVDKYGVTIFYTAPTLIRSLMRDGTELLKNMSTIKRSPIRVRATTHKAQGAEADEVETSGSKVDHDNTTKKVMKPTKIEKAVKSSRRGIDRSTATQIEAQDGGCAMHKKRNGGVVRKKRGSLRSSEQRLKEKWRHHNNFYDLQRLGEKSGGCCHVKGNSYDSMTGNKFVDLYGL